MRCVGRKSAEGAGTTSPASLAKKGAKPDPMVPRSNNLARYSSSPEASAAGAALTFE